MKAKVTRAQRIKSLMEDSGYSRSDASALADAGFGELGPRPSIGKTDEELLAEANALDGIYTQIAAAEEKHLAEATDTASLLVKAQRLLVQAANQEEGDVAADLAEIVRLIGDVLGPFLENPHDELRRAALDHRGLP